MSDRDDQAAERDLREGIADRLADDGDGNAAGRRRAAAERMDAARDRVEPEEDRDREAEIRDLRAGLDEGLRRDRPDEVERERRAAARREAAKDRADRAREREDEDEDATG